MEILLKIYKLSKKIRKWVLSIWISYSAGMITEYISESETITDVFMILANQNKLSVQLLWVLSAVLCAVWIISIIFEKIVYSRSKERQFYELMGHHTADYLNQAEIPGYSWGYQKNLLNPRNPDGWKPENFYVDLQDSDIDRISSFPSDDRILEGYTEERYSEYCKTDKIRIIQNRGDDRTRYALSYVSRNYQKNNNNQKIEIRLRATQWSRLQFSWDLLRNIDTYNRPIIHKNSKEIERLFVSALKQEQNPFLINSFCLHLIMVSSNGKVILSRISNVKANDYPSTWAATIGEQIEKEDFYIEETGEARKDWIAHWVKRALWEEFDISEEEYTNQEINELEAYVDMNSLRVLSLDFEGDIYNFALTCVVKMKITAEQMRNIKGIHVDGNENTLEFKEISEKDIRDILLHYPENSSQYHPSTYLRLLMYHLYSNKSAATQRQFVAQSKKTKRKEN